MSASSGIRVDEHGGHQDQAGGVRHDHDGAARQAVRQPTQEHRPDDVRQRARGERHGRQQRRFRPVVHQQRQRDEGKAVAPDRQDLRCPQGSELTHREHVAKGCPSCRCSACDAAHDCGHFLATGRRVNCHAEGSAGY